MAGRPRAPVLTFRKLLNNLNAPIAEVEGIVRRDGFRLGMVGSARLTFPFVEIGPEGMFASV